MSQAPDPGAARSPWWRRLLFFVGAVAWLAILGVAVAFRQQWIDVGDGVPKPVPVAAPKPVPPPPAPSRRAPAVDPGSVGMTHKEYEHLQQLPPYGVVKPGSALSEKLKRDLANKTRDGGT